MKDRLLVLRILWWCEIVVALRVLLFTVPVIITKQIQDSFSPIFIDDWFVLALTLIAIFYAAVGAVSLLGHKLWRQFHYLVTVLVLLLTAGLFNRMLILNIPVRIFYFLPLIISIGITALLIFRVWTKVEDKKWKSILVVDDDETLIRTIRPVLIKEGYSVLTANTGELGLEIVQAQKPDLIILDVILPKIKGREVCQKIKGNPETSSIPIIFLTAKDSKDDVEAELSVGGEAHLTKPFDRRELLTVIKKYLPGN